MLFMGRVCVSANSQMDDGPSHLKWRSALTVLTAVWPIFSTVDQIVYACFCPHCGFCTVLAHFPFPKDRDA